jgi:hypothetical protein
MAHHESHCKRLIYLQKWHFPFDVIRLSTSFMCIHIHSPITGGNVTLLIIKKANVSNIYAKDKVLFKDNVLQSLGNLCHCAQIKLQILR